MSEQIVKWVTRSYEGTSIRTGRRAYNDPTADAAIGHVMLEERRKKRQQSPPPCRGTGVWKPKEGNNA